MYVSPVSWLGLRYLMLLSLGSPTLMTEPNKGITKSAVQRMLQCSFCIVQVSQDMPQVHRSYSADVPSCHWFKSLANEAFGTKHTNTLDDVFRWCNFAFTLPGETTRPSQTTRRSMTMLTVGFCKQQWTKARPPPFVSSLVSRNPVAHFLTPPCLLHF